MINVTLKGGVVRPYEDGTTAMDVAKSLGAGLYKAACACKIDGALCDPVSYTHLTLPTIIAV